MPDLVYRVVSVCRLLGYGFPPESLAAAERGGLDAVVADAGSSEAGPYYLGSGTSYFSRSAVKADYRRMADTGRRLNIPVIVGNCGMAGGDRNVEWMLAIAREVFDELGIANAKVAVITSEVGADTVLAEMNAGALRYEATNPVLDADAVSRSTVVAQMGVHPLITALANGAQYIFAGRCCDVALFAADMVRRGVAPGTAFHAGHVLESGAVACEPGSPADCLVAEIYSDGSAIFEAPNPARRVTVQSLAAHGMHKRAHPLLHPYPEGILCLETTEYFARSGRTAGIRGSRLASAARPWPWSVRLEGVRSTGTSGLSLLWLDAAQLDSVPADVAVYGRNGVEGRMPAAGEQELGLVATATAPTALEATAVALHLSQEVNRYGFPTRKTSGGNLAYPIVPKAQAVAVDEGFRAIVPAGTRDPFFIANYPAIRAAALASTARAFNGSEVSFDLLEADADRPLAVSRSGGRRLERLEGSLLQLDADEAFEWSIAHLLQNERVIKEQLFPITYWSANGSDWVPEGTGRAIYFDIAEAYAGDLDERTLCEISQADIVGAAVGALPLSDMAVVIAGKNVGVDRLAFDIIFRSSEAYEAALQSNLFSREGLETMVGLEVGRVLGSYFVDSCNAIKIVLTRTAVSGSRTDRDVFGAQQQAIFEGLMVPIYSSSLSQSAFV